MKLFHTGDLHIGKNVNGFSLLEDQEHILKEIIRLVQEHKPEVFLIAGDVYDKAIPSEEAVRLFDSFLTALSNEKLHIIIISGNHDSGQRLGFGNRIMESKNIFMYTSYSGKTSPVILEDEFGKVNFYPLPFVRPSYVKKYFAEEDIHTYRDAVGTAVEEMGIDKKERNVLISHQFYSGLNTEPERSESEVGPVGGLDQVDTDILNEFDYAALGHLHGSQRAGADHICYSGSPLKYSFSEVHHKKGLNMIDLNLKGNVQITRLELEPLRDMRKIKGPIEELLKEEIAAQGNREDYLHVTLTDEEELLDAMGRVRNTYPNVMALEFDNKKMRASAVPMEKEMIEKESPMELFTRFFVEQNGSELTDDMEKIAARLLGGGE